jgi:hypothetical protein
MVVVFILLLIAVLATFFGIDIYTEIAGGSDIEVMGATVASLKDENVKILLGSAIAFLEFAIVLFAMLQRIADTIREVIKPVARLLPLGAFLTTIYTTFEPIVTSFFFAADSDVDVAAVVNSSSFSFGILLTLGTMLLFLLANSILGGDNAEIKALRAENAKIRRLLR